MNAKILIFGTLFLLGNMTLGAHELNREGMNFSEENRQGAVRKGVRDELKERLIDRGLDEDAASALAEKTFKNSDIFTSIQIHNYLATIETVDYDALMDHMVTRALFEKETDFGSYDSLVAMTRDLKSHYLEKETLEKLSQVSLVNNNLHAKQIVYM
ncbi:MAG: hypothetical protein U9N52_10240 [Campylobacterota bacterium]|nr:hypothetical protein [Campylobacterota bacterium]